MNKYKIIGEKLKSLRGGISQQEYSESVGISFRAYQRYEAGERVPPGPVLSKIAKFSGVTVDWILTGAESSKDRVTGPGAPYGLDKESLKILSTLQDMNKDKKIEALRIIEGLKLLSEQEEKLKKGKVKQ